MAATTRVTLDLDTLALSMATGAAGLDGSTVSEVISKTLRRHLIADYGPPPSTDPDRDRAEAEAAAADLAFEQAAARADHERRGRE